MILAAHYATLPIEEVVAEESRLLAAIASIEQGWFTGFSSLVSQRNRLSSRLRLVQHGLRIRRAGENEQVDALPPPIEPEGEFSRVRYPMKLRPFHANADACIGGKVDEGDPDEWDRVLQFHHRSGRRLTSLPVVAKQPGGSLGSVSQSMV